MDDHLFGDLLGGDPFAELSGSRFPPPVAHSSSPEPDLRRAHCSLVAAIEDIDGGSIPARLPMSGGARLSICARRNLVAVVETLSEVGSLLGDNTKEESRVTLRTWCKNGQLSQAALLLIVNVRDERLACRELPPEQVGNARAVHFHPGVDWMAVVGVDRVSLWERSSADNVWTFVDIAESQPVGGRIVGFQWLQAHRMFEFVANETFIREPFLGPRPQDQDCAFIGFATVCETGTLTVISRKSGGSWDRLSIELPIPPGKTVDMASLEPLQDRKIRAFVQTSPTTIDVHTIRVDLIAATIVIVPRDIPELSIKSLLGNGRDLCMWTTHRNQNNSNDSVDVLAVVTSLQRNFASVVAFSLHGNQWTVTGKCKNQMSTASVYPIALSIVPMSSSFIPPSQRVVNMDDGVAAILIANSDGTLTTHHITTCNLLMKQALPDNIMLKDVHSSASGFSSVFLVQDAHCTSATVRVVVSPNMWVDGSGSTGTVTTEYLSRSFAAALLNGHSYTDIVSATQTILYRLPPSTSPRKIIQAILWQTLTHITRANVPASSNFDFSEQLYATLYRCTGDEERSAFYPTRTWRDLMGLQLVLMHAAGEKVMAERTEMILRLVSMRECFQRAMVETEKVAFQRVTVFVEGQPPQSVENIMRAIIATNVTYTPAHLRTLAALSIASIDIFSTIIKGVYMDAHLVTEEHTGDISTNIALLCMPAVRRLMMELLVMINVLKVQVKRNLADSSKVNEAARNDILYVQVALARPRLRLDVLLKIVLDVGATMRSKVDIFPAAGVLEEKGSEQMRTCDPRIILLTLHHIHLLLGGSLPTAEDDMTLAQYWEMASRGRTRAPSIKHLISLSAQWHDLARQHILPTVISGFFGSGVPLEYQTVIEQRHQLKSGSIMQRTGLFMAPGVGTLGGLYDMARPAVDDVYMDVDDGDAAAWFEQSRLWLQTHEWFDVGTEEYGIIAETMPAYQCERCFGVSKVTSIIGETSGCICGGAWRAIVQ